MSVLTYNRTQSTVEYLFQIFQLNMSIAEIVENKPKKYKGTYSDILIHSALEALTKANMANDIFVTTKEDFETRRSLLLEARGQVYNVALVGDLFLELCKKSPSCDKAKCTRQQERIGKHCSDCLKLIDGVLKSDKKRYKGE